MADTKELKKIKKIYGEKFKNLCRELFPIIIEHEGTLLDILKRSFSNNSSSLYEDITSNNLVLEFKEYVFSKFDLQREEQVEEKRTPYEILDEAGYVLKECKTEEDIQSFKKYYRPSELLCTIYNGGRLKTNYCFFAVKKDVNKIRREDFKKPDKSDEYSTSVLGIQFSRDRASTVQIISRYNHSVPNPNCTLENDLDKLARGLTQSFTNLLKERGISLKQEKKENFRIPGYTVANDGRYYKYNLEIEDEYYCPENIIISHGDAMSIGEPERGLLIDNFYLNLQDKSIKDMTRNPTRDAFLDTLKNIEKIEVEKVEEAKKSIKIYTKDEKQSITIEVDKDSQIAGYTNYNVTDIGNKFLCESKALSKLELPNVRKVGDKFLQLDRELAELKLPNLQETGEDFLFNNIKLNKLELPNLQKVGAAFLGRNEKLKELKLPSLEEAGGCFLLGNKILKEIKLPKLRKTGEYFLSFNTGLSEIELPELREVTSGFLQSNEKLNRLELPNLVEIKDCFLMSNVSLTRMDLPNLQKVGDDFLILNKKMKELNLPNLQKVGFNFLPYREKLKTVNIPKLLCFEVDVEKNDGFAKDEKKELIDRIQGKLKIVDDQEKQIKELQQQIKEQRDFFEH